MRQSLFQNSLRIASFHASSRRNLLPPPARMFSLVTSEPVMANFQFLLDHMRHPENLFGPIANYYHHRGHPRRWYVLDFS